MPFLFYYVTEFHETPFGSPVFTNFFIHNIVSIIHIEGF